MTEPVDPEGTRDLADLRRRLEQVEARDTEAEALAADIEAFRKRITLLDVRAAQEREREKAAQGPVALAAVGLVLLLFSLVLPWFRAEKAAGGVEFHPESGTLAGPPEAILEVTGLQALSDTFSRGYWAPGLALVPLLVLVVVMLVARATLHRFTLAACVALGAISLIVLLTTLPVSAVETEEGCVSAVGTVSCPGEGAVGIAVASLGCFVVTAAGALGLSRARDLRAATP